MFKSCKVKKIRQQTWELCKLGDFYFFKNGLNKEKEYFGKGTPIVNFTDVYHNRGLYSNTLNGKVTLSDSEIERYKVEKGDLFFTRTSESIEEIGMNSVMLNDAIDTVFSGFILRGRAIEKDPLNNLIKKYIFSTKVFRNEMIKKSSMTTRALTSGTALREMYFYYPVEKDEQKRIGSLLTSLENTIALHQRKLDNLTALKASYLEKIMPNRKEKEPQMKFSNDDSVWKRMKLGDVLSLPVKYPITENKDLKLMTLKLRGKGIKLSANRETLALGSTVYYKRSSSQFLYGKQNFFNGSMAIIPEEADGYATSGDVPALDINNELINKNFLLYFISRPNYYKHKESFSIGTGSKRIHEDTLLNFDILVPTIQTQEKIVNFLQLFDEQINYNQQKLKEIELIKKFFLAQMFL